jgi:Kef-type K+ transport system membrane component KefB
LGYLTLVANIGLTFYLFIIGIELDTKLLMTHARRTAGIAIAGMAIPFCIGIAVRQTMIDTLRKIKKLVSQAFSFSSVLLFQLLLFLFLQEF